jgi:hypothetical protein
MSAREDRLQQIQRVQKYGAHGTLGAIGQFVVIQSLREGDWQTGRMIREDLEPMASEYKNRLQVHYRTPRTPAEFEYCLKDLAAWVRHSGRAPCLHIECHGDKDGVELTDGSYMSWSRVKPLLADINVASRMNMLLVLASCNGGYFAAECRYDEPVPFVYMVGPGNEIYAEPLFALTGGFYSELFRSWDVTEALTAGGGGRADISYFSMSAVGVLRIGLAARIRAAGPAEARAKLRAAEGPLFEQWRRRFFALDQFPENADRFAITYDEVFAEVEAGPAGPP